eukprot:Pompholyxophrys_punicea_v1_NODE_136_length_3267_cov_3.636364.p4 type:complete len:129 gc:universal NODE_136_length_3267_cov_3.636364:987-1373(+)
MMRLIRPVWRNSIEPSSRRSIKIPRNPATSSSSVSRNRVGSGFRKLSMILSMLVLFRVKNRQSSTYTQQITSWALKRHGSCCEGVKPLSIRPCFKVRKKFNGLCLSPYTLFLSLHTYPCCPKRRGISM